MHYGKIMRMVRVGGPRWGREERCLAAAQKPQAASRLDAARAGAQKSTHT